MPETKHQLWVAMSPTDRGWRDFTFRAANRKQAKTKAAEHFKDAEHIVHYAKTLRLDRPTVAVDRPRYPLPVHWIED